jgi:hypothetical protein
MVALSESISWHFAAVSVTMLTDIEIRITCEYPEI